MYKLYRQKIKGGIVVDEIKVGDYVRLKSGLIGQFYNIEEGYDGNIQINFEEFGYEYENIEQFYDDIKKHSKNIIDLIEAGDIVNGYRILDIADSIYKNSKRILIYRDTREEKWIYIQEFDGKIHTQDDINTILTKEQHERNCYRLEND